MNRHKLTLLLLLVLSAGFVSTSLVSYTVSKHAIRTAITEDELPLTADNIYSEIQKDLVRTVFIASMMASDTFLRDWVLDGEKSEQRIQRYLREVQERYGTFVSFLVSERSRNYYYSNGILKQVKQSEPRDAWYFRVRTLQQPYELNVDKDLAHADALTIFVNYRVMDYADRYIGAAGVGLTVDSVQSLINSYQNRYHRNVYFVDPAGTIILGSNQQRKPGSNIRDIQGMADILPDLLSKDSGSYQYHEDGGSYLINSRYIPELKWYLLVEKNESEATSSIRYTLYLNLLFCLLITAGVILVAHIVLKRYELRAEMMATTDALTGLPNRRAFDVIATVLFNESARNKTPVAILMLDIDHFKSINDRYGHLGGDYVLSEVARVIKNCLRAADFVCRWGGEEFLIIAKDCNSNSVMALAEKIRQSLQTTGIVYKGKLVSLTASLGAGVLQADENISLLIERADNALYRAKSSGRNKAILSETRLHDLSAHIAQPIPVPEQPAVNVQEQMQGQVEA